MLLRWSKLFIPTLREAPAGIETEGARLLARAGYQRGNALLFLGRRGLRRIVNTVRTELDALGAQEILAPTDQPMTRLARELRSYKQLPQIWYQFQDALEVVSFDQSAASREQRYRAIREAFQTALRRCGVEFLIADSLAGATFAVPCESGEDSITRAGDYVADLASAVSIATPPALADPEGSLPPEPFHTPNRRTIAELAEFTGLPETSHIKSLVMWADGALVMALLRGDHQLSESKFAHVLRAHALRPATPDEMRQSFGASAGSLGPLGVSGIRILADEALRGRRNMIAGANRDDYHLRNVTPGVSFNAEFLDLRQAAAGEKHPGTGEPLRIEGVRSLASLVNDCAAGELHVSGEDGKEAPVFVASYSLSLSGVLWAAAEQHHDPDGLILPAAIAPFDLIVTLIEPTSEPQRSAAETMAGSASPSGLEVLLDDRDERPGVKFKDADLTGVPWRITIGKKLEQGIVEVFERRTKQKSDVPVSEAIGFIRTRR